MPVAESHIMAVVFNFDQKAQALQFFYHGLTAF